MTRTPPEIFLLVASATFYWSTSAPAQIVVPNLDSSSNLNVFSTATPGKLTDNSGLSAAVNNGATLAAAQAATHLFNGGFNESWTTNASTADYFATGTGGANPPQFVWDLGSAQTVNNLVLWQYQNNGGNNTNVGNHARTVELRFSDTTTFSGSPFAANFSPVFGAGATNAAQSLSLSAAPGADNAQFVEVTIVDNARGLPGVTGGGDRVGMGEIRFDTSAPGGVRSDTLVTPTAISQTAGNNLGGFEPINLINDKGFGGSPPTIDNFAATTHAPNDGGESRWVTATATFPNYFNGANPNPQFELTLDDVYNLTDLVVWGYGGNANESSDFTVEFSDDGGSSFYDSVDVQTGAMISNQAAVLSFDDEFLADFVRLTITDNVDGRGLTGAAGGDRAGLGEIKFLAAPAAAVPEPTSIAIWSLIGLGLAGFGYYRVRRKK